MRYDIQSEIRQLQERLVKLNRELVEYKILHAQAMSHANSLEDKCAALEQSNDQYMAWFNNHKYLITPRPEPITGPETLYQPLNK